MAKTRDALKIIDRITGRDTVLRKAIAKESLNFRVAKMIYEQRTAAGFTQRQLADMVGTKQSVISRLEDAAYDGHSLAMLRKIAEALNGRLEVRIVGTKKRATSPAKSPQR